MRNLVLAGILAAFAGFLSPTGLLAQAPAQVRIDLQKPLPKKLDLAVNQYVAFTSAESIVTVKETDGKGKLLQPLPSSRLIHAFTAVRAGEGEITVVLVMRQPGQPPVYHRQKIVVTVRPVQ